MEFRVLGPLEMVDDGRPVDVGPPRVRAVLAVLLAHPGGLVAVDEFVDELWPDRPPENARALVHSYVSRLRRALRHGPSGPAAATRLVTRRPGYLLRVDDGELDARRFEQAASRARAARHEGAPHRSLGLYRQALDLWRGAPFADVPPVPCVAGMITRLAEQRLITAEERFDTALDSGLGTGLEVELAELAVRYPLRERLIGQLMLALYRTGRTADALHAFTRLRSRLAGELGIDPSPALRHRYEQILRNDPELNPTYSPAVGVPDQQHSDGQF
jgi:DNA-binding SARP family transcriptional activator